MSGFTIAILAMLLDVTDCRGSYFAFIGFHMILRSKEYLANSITAHAPWTLGLPFTAIGSFALVTLLPAVIGDPLEFKELGFEFKGSSSQVVFWVICFLASCIGIRLVTPAAAWK